MSNLATITNNILADSGIDDINVVVTTGSYSNPAWITALSWTKITDRPTTLSGYGITDAYTQTQVNTLLAGYLPLSGGTMTGQIVLTTGTSGGIRFPNDPFGGGGDTAGMRLISRGGEAMSLEIYTTNDADDWVNLVVPSNDSAKINGNTIWHAGNITPVPTSRTITINGTTQDLSANRTYNVGTVTSVTASSPLASSGGTTPNITIQQANGSQNGFLSSTDWTTFNNKQNALTNPVTGTGTTNYLPKFTGSTTIGNSIVQEGGAGILISGTDNFTSQNGGWFFNGSGNYASGIFASSSSNILTLRSPQNISFQIGFSTPSMTLTSGGNLLVGTTTDNGARLQVSGTSTFSSNVGIGTSNIGSDFGQLFISGANTDTNFTDLTAQRFLGGDATIAITNTTSLNGTFASIQLAPRGTNGNIHNFAIIAESTSSTFSSNLIFANRTNTSIMTERMRITSSGNVLIGTTTDDGYKLKVAGEIGLDSYLRHNGDTDTFFGFSGSDEIKFRTAGTDRMFIASSGRVGINTPTPDTNGFLTVAGTGATASIILHRTNSGPSGGKGALGWKSVNGFFTASITELSGNDDTGSLIFRTQANSTATSPFSVTERMRITSSGNVLIGTTTDTGEKLQVSGNIRTNSGYIQIRNSSNPSLYINNNSAQWQQFVNSSNNLVFSDAINNVLTLAYNSGAATFSSSVTATELYLSTSNGLVGNINSSNANGGYLTWQTNGTTIADIGTAQQIFGSGGNAVFGINGRGSRDIAFGTNNSERMRITSGGNVGIGTPSPRSKADVNGILTVGDGNPPLINLYRNVALGNNSGFGTINFGGRYDATNYGTGASIFTNSVGVWSSTNYGGNLIFATTPQNSTTLTERMQITSGGDISLNGGSSSSGNATATPKNIRFNNDYSSGYTDASLKIFLFNSGSIIQGFTSGPAYDLQYHSSGSSSGRHAFYVGNNEIIRFNQTNVVSTGSITATSFFESSDATLKTLVEDDYQANGIESVVAKLYIKNGKQELGYYAQDLENILPSAVSKGSDGLLNLSYREVHTAKIAALEKEIAELKKQLKNN